MKKSLRILLGLAVILALLNPICAKAAVSPRIVSIGPSIFFSGTTATCIVNISGLQSTDTVSLTAKLWHSGKCIATWTDSGTGYLFFSETASVTKGETYTLTVDVVLSGTSLPRRSTSATCK